MRSFQLFSVILSFFLLVPSSQANSAVIPTEFFTVTLPYGDSVDTAAKVPLDGYAQKAMPVLLMRLTGRSELLDSKLGQTYINQAKKWLASYYIKPRLEDGVVVGQNIALRFDANRLKQAFQQQHIKLLSAAQRPPTLVMGAFIQQGRLQKLTEETLRYRIDVDFRDYPQALKLPIKVPDSANHWIYPVDASNNLSKVQEAMIRESQQNLLSFKLQSSNGQYQLDWRLFALNGDTLSSGSSKGAERSVLYQIMFNDAMQQYAKITAVETLQKNHIWLQVNQIGFGEQLKMLEKDLLAQQPLITHVMLKQVSAGQLNFDIEYQGEYQSLINWLQSWSKVEIINSDPAAQKIEVNAKVAAFIEEPETSLSIEQDSASQQ
ncbi:DUF2066 domain-containing protein [Thiomicrorhabdus sediminis]|uniref:DUF2066 domain-containing protein n=1 Tax=Thiomicrorhabdus sediminis TaxID=2580412 RepID=A0A4P9K5T0_9GAMM|nr:DUF2066 domain-containing protein [Thiomicrorhabdus sediminis]QCU89830.1 DUF2066 domain-containing protein [Thiomicrorhabdus sediminis]